MSATAYDRVPYQSNPYVQCHVDHLAMLATLFGMTPAPIEGARVLEIGCGAGGNLLPMATALPGATFVGFDLAPTMIAQAQAAIDDVGLTNVTVETASILDVDASWGEFDYIVAHGIYSWVPEPVAKGILAICKRNLAPDGVAYVSFNALPAWRLRGVAREIMLHHTRALTDPAERVAQARAVISFLASVVPAENEWGLFLQNEVKRLRTCSDWYLFHDNLAEHNHPYWFREFMASALGEGLQYLAEAAFGSMLLSNLPKEASDVLATMGSDIVELEQYMDFVRNRGFRQTLLCHADRVLERNIDWRSMTAFAFTTRALPVGRVDARDGLPSTFKTADDVELTVEAPLIKAMMLELALARRVAIPFDVLVERSRARAGITDPATLATDRETLGRNLLSCFAKEEIVMPRRWPRTYLNVATQRPLVWTWARHQARTGSPYVTNLRHEGVKLDPFQRRVVALLDGTRTREDLDAALIAMIDDGTLSVNPEEGSPLGPDDVRREVPLMVEATLEILAGSAVLVG
jgi:methyltransferase-like protein/2-polyprenyl-3-methyl-5-hydroxy-6-metoxy-1,4-benzoquinol methylase